MRTSPVAALAASILAVTPANADTLVYSGSDQFFDPLIYQFDASLGTLNSVTFNVSFSGSYSLFLAAPSTSPLVGDVSWSTSGVATAFLAGQSFALPVSGSGTESVSFYFNPEANTNNAFMDIMVSGSASYALDPAAYTATGAPEHLFASAGYSGWPADTTLSSTMGAQNLTTFDGYICELGGAGGRHTCTVSFYELIYNFTPAGAVPEPGTWAMMLVGFGAVGFAMRRRRQAAMLTRAPKSHRQGSSRLGPFAGEVFL